MYTHYPWKRSRTPRIVAVDPTNMDRSVPIIRLACMAKVTVALAHKKKVSWFGSALWQHFSTSFYDHAEAEVGITYPGALHRSDNTCAQAYACAVYRALNRRSVQFCAIQ